jgi:hypothetical protein
VCTVVETMESVEMGKQILAKSGTQSMHSTVVRDEEGSRRRDGGKKQVMELRERNG